MTRIAPAMITDERSSQDHEWLPEVDEEANRELAKFLDWFSIGLGLAEVFAPDRTAVTTGVYSRDLIQLYGLREIATGGSILTSNRPERSLWARVIGDALDLVTLATGAKRDGRSAAAAATVAGITALDVLCAQQLSRERR